MSMLPQPFPILIQMLVGALAGFYFVKVIKRPVLGNIWGAIIVGVIGSVLGGFFLDTIIKYMVNSFFAVNFVAALFGGFFLIWVFSKLTHH